MNRREFLENAFRIGGLSALFSLGVGIKEASALTAAMKAAVGASGAVAPTSDYHGFTYGAGASNSGTANTVQLTGVSAGDLIVIGARWTGSDANASISDGTSSFTMGTRKYESSSGVDIQFGYLLSSVATGTVTYTVTVSGSPANFKLEAMRITPTAGSIVSYDTQNGAVGSTGTTGDSGSISTGAANTIVFGLGYSAGSMSARYIGGAAPTGAQVTSVYNAMWYTIYTSTQTNISASFTQASSAWLCEILSIKN